MTNGQPSLSFNLKTPFGQTPNLTLPTVAPFQPAPLQFTLDPAGAINSDPLLRSLPGAIAAQQNQQAQQALSSFVPPTFDILPSAPAAPSFGPGAPVPLFSLPGTSGASSPAYVAGWSGLRSSGPGQQRYRPGPGQPAIRVAIRKHLRCVRPRRDSGTGL